MKKFNNKTASTVLICAMVGNFALPVLAQEEFTVLPPIDEAQSQSYTPSATQTNTYTQPQQNNFQQVNYSNQQPLFGTVTTVPVGTTFQIITNSEVNSKTTRVGEFFSATLSQPIVVGPDIVVPAGSEVYGQITYSEEAGRVGRNANMEIKFTGIKPVNGNRIPMVGKVLTKDGSGILKGGSVKEQLVKSTAYAGAVTAGGLAAGAGLGAIAGKAGAGAVLGSVVGGIVGIGYVIMRKGRNVELPVGTGMIISLEQPLTVGQ